MGSCRKGEACTYSHTIDPGFQRRPCRHYAKGRCHKGDACTFSHDITATPPSLQDGATRGSAQVAAAHASSGTEAVFKQWRYRIPAKASTARPLGGALADFFQQALVLVGGEPGLMQEVITLLAAEGGMIRVAELLDQQFASFNDRQLDRIFNGQLLPFFKTIAHKNVCASVILESHIMTIYNYVFGVGGRRTVSLFTAVTRHLSTRTIAVGEDDSTDGEEDNSGMIAFETSLAVLSKVMEVNSTAQVTDGLRPLVETLAALLVPADGVVPFATRASVRHLHSIEQRVGLGRTIPEARARVGKGTAEKATFVIEREMPGDLSEEGPRHDNDSVDIRNISILPTLQEIQSSRTEYLPLADPKEWHIGGLEGLLDRHFRLLREDTVGQLRDAAKSELERLQNPTKNTNDDRKHQGVRTYVYEDVQFADIGFDSFKGLEFALAFKQPPELRNKTATQRRDWWEWSKRFGFEALVCLLSSEGSAIFFVVSDQRESPKPKHEEVQLDEPKAALQEKYNLWTDPNIAFVVARLIDINNGDVRNILSQMIQSARYGQMSLVEFSGVLLPAFQPTLQALQQMSTTLDLPFADIISSGSTQDWEQDLPAPGYISRRNFTFDLSSITKDNKALHMAPGQPFDLEALKANTTLDHAQADALVTSLSRSVALIQGPPGTGKSYTGVALIKVLLANKDRGELGPIVCVCYTNHALDQLLEHLFDAGVPQIIRVGSRSKSERLAEVNLRQVSRKLELTKTEKQEHWKLKTKINEETKEINHIMQQLSRAESQTVIEAYLLSQYPAIHGQLFNTMDDEGFTAVNYHPEATIERWLHNHHATLRPLRSLDALRTGNLFRMTGPERKLLHNSWISEIKEDLLDRLMIALQSYERLKNQSDLIRKEVELRVLTRADVIGITTSGLARNLNLLRKLSSKVLVCEEAGEVLEAHLLTALLPSVEHAILIGDHLQLRPQIQNYELSTESSRGEQYALDVSLFERLVQPRNLIVNGVPFCTLELQRRMHPSIAQLIRRTLYPALQDSPIVNDYPEVAGLRERLFWLDHDKAEDANGPNSTSRTNAFEVEMTAALVSHLVRQGVYRADDIAVLTPYLGQLRKIRMRLSNSFEILLNDRDAEDLAKDDSDDEAPSEAPPRASVSRGTLLQALRIATVDNFQGEEAKGTFLLIQTLCTAMHETGSSVKAYRDRSRS